MCLTCQSFNNSKGSKLLEEWMQWKGCHEESELDILAEIEVVLPLLGELIGLHAVGIARDYEERLGSSLTVTPFK